MVQSHLAVKGGSCPPPTQIDVCYDTCNTDEQCEGNTKCCATSCGGAVCTKPVTQREQQAQGKTKIGSKILGDVLCSMLKMKEHYRNF